MKTIFLFLTFSLFIYAEDSYTKHQRHEESKRVDKLIKMVRESDAARADIDNWCASIGQAFGLKNGGLLGCIPKPVPPAPAIAVEKSK